MIGKLAIKIGEDLEADGGVGHGKDRKTRMQIERVRELEKDRTRSCYWSKGQYFVQ